MAGVGDQDPEGLARLAAAFPDSGSLFPERRRSTLERALVKEIRASLAVRNKHVAPKEILASVRRPFPQVREEAVHQLLNKPALFHRFDGRYGNVTTLTEANQYAGPLARNAEGLRGPHLEYLPRRGARDPDAPAARDVRAESDLWTSWFARLGSDPAYCHMWLRLEPEDRERLRHVDLGVILFAGPEPSWFLYATAMAAWPVVSYLRDRRWSVWLPHDRVGSPFHGHLASERYVQDPSNDLVVGAHFHRVEEVWEEVDTLVREGFRIPHHERVDAEWAPIDEHVRDDAVRRRRLLEAAFTWVSERTEGSVPDPARYSRHHLPEAQGTCLICGRDLHVEESVDRQMGPWCRKKALERLNRDPDLFNPWGGPEGLLERMATSGYRVPLAHWAYSRELTTAMLRRQ